MDAQKRDMEKIHPEEIRFGMLHANYRLYLTEVTT